MAYSKTLPSFALPIYIYTPAGGVICNPCSSRSTSEAYRDKRSCSRGETITEENSADVPYLSIYTYRIYIYIFFFHDISGVFYETAGSGVGLHRPPTADARCLSLLITRNSRRRQVRNAPKMFSGSRRKEVYQEKKKMKKRKKKGGIK